VGRPDDEGAGLLPFSVRRARSATALEIAMVWDEPFVPSKVIHGIQ
ncbi:unnamed protein product, partial [Acidithrix sp. C25]